MLPFSHLTDNGISDVDENGDDANKNGPVQMERLNSGSRKIGNGLVDRAIRKASLSLIRFQGISNQPRGVFQSKRFVMQTEQTGCAQDVLQREKKQIVLPVTVARTNVPCKIGKNLTKNPIHTGDPILKMGNLEM